MSRLDKLLEAQRNGVVLLGQERDEAPTQPSVPAPALPPRPVPVTPTAVETPKTLDELPQELIDYVQEASNEKVPEYGKGLAWSLAAEIGGGIGSSLALTASTWGKRGLNALRNVKNLGKIGVFTPEGGSTVAGAALMVGAEGFIWGLSNYVGQTIREEYGLQDHYSVGEGIAATVFGLTPIYRGVGIALKLPESPLAGIGFRSREMVTTTGKIMVQGAVIGMAETALRQEVQLILNEREDRNPYEYLLSATIGGVANAGFTSIGAIWSRTGKWGRDQATEAVTRAQANLRRRRDEYKEAIETAQGARADEGGYVNPARQESLTGGYQRQTKLDEEFFDETTAVKQMEQLGLAADALDDVLVQIVRASKAADKRKSDLMPSKITDETLEAPLPKPPKKDVSDDSDEGLVLGFRKIQGKDTKDPEFANKAQILLAEALIKKGIKNGKTNEEIRKELANAGFMPVSTHADVEGVGMKEMAAVRFGQHYVTVGGGDARHGDLVNKTIDQIREGGGLLDKVRTPRGADTTTPAKKDVSDDAPTAPKAPEVDEDIPLGLRRSPFIDPNLTKLDDEAFDALEIKTRKELEKLEEEFDGFPIRGTEVDAPVAFKKKLAAAQDAYSAVELEKFRKQIEGEEAWFIASEFRTLANATQNSETVFKLALLGETVNKRGIQKEVFAELNKKIGKDENAKEVFEGQLKKAKEAMEAFKNPPAKQIEADAPTTPKAPTKEPTQQPEGDEIDALAARFAKVNKDNMTLELPDIAKAANVIREKHVEGIEDGIRILAKKGNENDRATLESLIDHVRNLNRVETEVLDTVETTFGRTGQGLRDDAERFKYIEEYSKRARDSKQTLNQLEKALQKRLDGAEIGDLSRLLDDYTSLKPRMTIENKTVRKTIEQREKDLETLTPEQLAKKEAKEIKKLEAKLEKLRKQFGDDSTIKPQDVAKKPEKTAEIKDLQERIKDHQAYRSDAIRLGERLKERERLLAVETGTLGAQRAEVSKKPTGPKKTSGQLEKVNADIAFLKKNMKNRVQEIDKAQKEMSPEFQAEKIREAYQALGNRLEKELNEYRARFGDMDAVEARADAPAKPTPEKPQDIKDKEELLKFYRDGEAEALAVVKLEKELARVADVEGRGIMGEMRAETTPKPKGPTKPSRSAELRKKIQQSRTRMRVRTKQIDKAQEEILKDREMSEIYSFYEQTFNAAMNKDKLAMFVSVNRWANEARQMGLINQVISVTTGVATNVLATFKQFFRGGLASVPIIGRIKGTEILSPSFLAYKLSDKLPMSVARANARADAFGAWMSLKDRDGLFGAMVRTFMENVGTTTGQGGKFSDEVAQTTLPRGINALVARAHKKAKRRAMAAENVGNAFSRLFETKNPFTILGTAYLNLLSPGVRGIQTVDELFRRQLIKGQIWADATKEAIKDQIDPLTGRLAANFDSAKAERQAIVNYNAAWKQNDGIAVLKVNHQYKDAVDNINQELLFAANAERVDDLIEPLSEPFIKWVNSINRDDTTLAKALRKTLILAGSPYVGVPTRAGYRSAHYAGATVGLHKAGKSNAYSGEIKKVEAKIKANEESLRTNDKLSEAQKAETIREIRDLQERLDVLVIRRARQNREDLTDMLFSWSLLTFGMYMATEGGTGSLDWMSAKQRRDSKLEPFTWNGINYKTASPYSMALALGANAQQWWQAKEEQTLTGVKVLEKDFLSMLASTFITVNLEQPFLQGLKQSKEMAQGVAAAESDTYAKERAVAAVARMLSSYFSIVFPVQAKKIVERITTKGVADFRGGSFQDRMIYGVIGKGPANIKTDRLGEPIADNKTWLNQNLWRLFPSGAKEATEFEKIETGTSLFGAMSDKPTQLKATGVRMVDWIDEEGFSLASTFDKFLRKRQLSKEVERLVKDRGWQSSFKEGWIPEGDKYTNEAITELNEVLREAWNETSDEILSDSVLLKRFVKVGDKEGKNLYEHLEKRETQEDTPKRVRMLQDIIENN